MKRIHYPFRIRHNRSVADHSSLWHTGRTGSKQGIQRIGINASASNLLKQLLINLCLNRLFIKRTISPSNRNSFACSCISSVSTAYGCNVSKMLLIRSTGIRDRSQHKNYRYMPRREMQPHRPVSYPEIPPPQTFLRPDFQVLNRSFLLSAPAPENVSWVILSATATRS